MSCSSSLPGEVHQAISKPLLSGAFKNQPVLHGARNRYIL
jgi:hypothetical protein